jgi:peroxiredoxin
MTEEDASSSKKGLSIGSSAPIIETKDVYNNEITLEVLLQRFKGVFIDFFRGAWWKPCKQHLHNLKKNITKFEKRKIKIITIATDSVNHLKKFSEENGFEFTMISDRGAKISKAYNVYTFGSMLDMSFMKTKMAIPSTFLIDSNGKIVWRYIGARTDRPSIEILTTAIDENI